MKLQEIMVGHVVQASPEESIGEAARYMREKAVGCLVVTVEGHIKGLSRIGTCSAAPGNGTIHDNAKSRRT